VKYTRNKTLSRQIVVQNSVTAWLFPGPNLLGFLAQPEMKFTIPFFKLAKTWWRIFFFFHCDIQFFFFDFHIIISFVDLPKQLNEWERGEHLIPLLIFFRFAWIRISSRFCFRTVELELINILGVEEKVVVIHRGRCNNKVYYRLSHDVVTWDVDRDVSTAYC